VTGHTPNTLRLGRGFILAMQPIKSLEISPRRRFSSHHVCHAPTSFHSYSLHFSVVVLGRVAAELLQMKEQVLIESCAGNVPFGV
jgi:hypothetical protein